MENTRDELIQVGAYIESKNGVEFYARIDKIEGSKVTVKWTNDWQDDCYQTIEKRIDMMVANVREQTNNKKLAGEQLTELVGKEPEK